MPGFGERENTTTMAEHIRVRRPRNEINTESSDPAIFPSVNQSTRSKPSTIASLFNPNSNSSKKKLNNTFRGLGCTAAAAQQVSLPAVIRSSADWDGKNVKKKKKKQKKNAFVNAGEGGSSSVGNNATGSCMVVQDVWCGPGIGLSADAVVGSVDCVVSRRNLSARGKIDGDKLNHRDRDRDRDREVWI